MSKPKGGSIRDQKRARFTTAGKETRRMKPAWWLGGLLVLLVLAGILWAAWPRSSPLPSAEGASGSAVAAGDAPVRTALVAATLGHAPYPEVQAEDGLIRLPVAAFADGQARYYTYMLDGRPLEFFVVADRGGQPRVAFNACDVCFAARKGYHQEGDVMVCNNCGRRFPLDQIGIIVGGCNPSPLRFQVEGDTLLVRVQDLATGAGLFTF